MHISEIRGVGKSKDTTQTELVATSESDKKVVHAM